MPEWKWGTRFHNAKEMHDGAREHLDKLLGDKRAAVSDQGKNDFGIGRDLARSLEAFDAVDARHKRNTKVRRRDLTEKLKKLTGAKPREPGDVSGQLMDQEIRQWYRSLKGKALSDLNTHLREGDHPEIAQAILRAPPQLTGLDVRADDFIDVLTEHATHPDHLEEVQGLREELQAIASAEQEWEKARRVAYQEVSEYNQPAVGELQARNAVEDELGLRRSKDKPNQFEPIPDEEEEEEADSNKQSDAA